MEFVDPYHIICMSRLAKKPVVIPPGVTVNLTSEMVHVKGPKGELQRPLPEHVHIAASPEGYRVSVDDLSDSAQRGLLGLWVRLLENMVKGVTVGFERALEVKGIGYKVAVAGKEIVLDIGFSHEVRVAIPEGLEARAEKNVLTVRGIDKELVGGFIVTIRCLRPPEPYKGKGIMLVGEVVRRKAGKAAKAAGAKA